MGGVAWCLQILQALPKEEDDHQNAYRDGAICQVEHWPEKLEGMAAYHGHPAPKNAP